MLVLATGDTLAAVGQTATTLTSTVFGMELNAGTEVYKVLDQRQLAAAAATIYTAPASTTTFVKNISLVNTNTTTAQTFQFFRGGTAAANAITPIMVIPIGGSANYEDGGGWEFFDNFGRVLSSSIAANFGAVLIADTATQTSTTGAIMSPVLTIPANYVLAGTTIEFQLGFSTAQGAVAQTAPGHFFELRWGGVAGTVIATVGTVTPATLLAATAGYLNGFLTIRTIGASGTCKASMTVINPRGTRIAAGDMTSKAGISAAGSGVVINTTTANDLVITSDNQVADAAALTFGIAGYFSLIK